MRWLTWQPPGPLLAPARWFHNLQTSRSTEETGHLVQFTDRKLRRGSWTTVRAVFLSTLLTIDGTPALDNV